MHPPSQAVYFHETILSALYRRLLFYYPIN